MQHRSRALAALISVAGAVAAFPLGTQALAQAGGGATSSATAPKPAPKGVTVDVTITELRNTKGVIRACMSPDPDRFPRCQGDASAYRTVVPANGKAEIHFTGVKPGRYAIALLHDENDNGKADRVLGMMPREGFGFSRDAKVKMGPPKFDDAAFDIGSDAVHQTIRMRYML